MKLVPYRKQELRKCYALRIPGIDLEGSDDLLNLLTSLWELDQLGYLHMTQVIMVVSHVDSFIRSILKCLSKDYRYVFKFVCSLYVMKDTVGLKDSDQHVCDQAEVEKVMFTEEQVQSGRLRYMFDVDSVPSMDGALFPSVLGTRELIRVQDRRCGATWHLDLSSYQVLIVGDHVFVYRELDHLKTTYSVAYGHLLSDWQLRMSVFSSLYEVLPHTGAIDRISGQVSFEIPQARREYSIIDCHERFVNRRTGPNPQLFIDGDEIAPWPEEFHWWEGTPNFSPFADDLALVKAQHDAVKRCLDESPIPTVVLFSCDLDGPLRPLIRGVVLTDEKQLASNIQLRTDSKGGPRLCAWPSDVAFCIENLREFRSSVDAYNSSHPDDQLPIFSSFSDIPPDFHGLIAAVSGSGKSTFVDHYQSSYMLVSPGRDPVTYGEHVSCVVDIPRYVLERRGIKVDHPLNTFVDLAANLGVPLVSNFSEMLHHPPGIVLTSPSARALFKDKPNLIVPGSVIPNWFNSESVVTVQVRAMDLCRGLRFCASVTTGPDFFRALTISRFMHVGTVKTNEGVIPASEHAVLEFPITHGIARFHGIVTKDIDLQQLYTTVSGVMPLISTGQHDDYSLYIIRGLRRAITLVRKEFLNLPGRISGKWGDDHPTVKMHNTISKVLSRLDDTREEIFRKLQTDLCLGDLFHAYGIHCYEMTRGSCNTRCNQFLAKGGSVKYSDAWKSGHYRWIIETCERGFLHNPEIVAILYVCLCFAFQSLTGRAIFYYPLGSSREYTFPHTIPLTFETLMLVSVKGAYHEESDFVAPLETSD